jgi:hypothetical protein
MFLAFGSILYSGHCVFAQTDQVDQTAAKLQAANSAVEQAFNAVLDSEKAGANVTGLLSLLNVAAGDLAQAENSYHSGDSNKAMAQVAIVSEITQEVTNSAQDAKQTALVSGQQTFWFTIAFSVIAASVLILVLSLVWRRFKRGYMEKIPSLGPEVAESET